MLDNKFRVHIEGCSPYGFRLTGGNGQPVLITKLRAKSKASVAGLLNGDIVLAINGYNCSDVSYERLVTLVEHSGHSLELDIQRSKQQTAHQQKPTSYTKSSSLDALLESRDWLDAIYSNNIDFNTSPVSPPPAAVHRPTYKLPVDEDLPPPIPPLPASVRHTYNTTAAAGYMSPDYASPEYGSPPDYRSPTGFSNGSGGFDLHSNSRAVRDTRDERRPSVISTSDVVDVRWNPADKSVTMSLNLLSSSSPSPPRTPVRHRNESFIMINSPPVTHKTQQVWQLSPPEQQPLHQPTLATWRSPSPPPLPPVPSLPQNIMKILTPSSEADSLPPTSTITNKKMFADSSFYDNPANNYPTVEEQIKMARQVAQSITSPANQSARGQTMFLKRRAKSVEWTAMPDDDTDIPSSSLPAAPYFNSPFIPTVTNTDQTKAMSSDEYERLQMFDKNSTQHTVAPQVCFNIAQNLKQLNDKGARMFAKRRAKVDKWTIENGPNEQAMKRIVNGFKTTASAPVSSPAAAATTMGGWDFTDHVSPSCRLTEMIQAQRARMTPWDAAVTYGNVEPAFEHLGNINFVQQQARPRTVY